MGFFRRRGLGRMLICAAVAAAAICWAGCGGDSGAGTTGGGDGTGSGTGADSTAAADSGAFTDARDGQTYRQVKIGSQVWMAQNLNYKPETGNSWCYDNADSNCAKYGRLYDWETAMAACPEGWRLPDTADWNILIETAGGVDVAGLRLKATLGWNEDYLDDWGWGNGIDVYGFSALPGGHRGDFNSFSGFGEVSMWWTASTRGGDFPLIYFTSCSVGFAVRVYNSEKTDGYSVRCLKE